jgi:hypothetical protein
MLLPSNSVYLVANKFIVKLKRRIYVYIVKHKIIHFLIALLRSTQQLAKANFGLVPNQDFTKSWTDAELYVKYGLTNKERTFIKIKIKPMD